MNDQPKPIGEVMVAGCEITGGSSRVCEHGQKSCEIRHTKPTGEWTGLILSRLIKEKGYKGTADAHNAELDAAVHGARTQWDDDRIKGATRGALKGAEMLRRIKDLEQQLAAEREKVKLRDLLVRTWQDNYADLLAKVGK